MAQSWESRRGVGGGQNMPQPLSSQWHECVCGSKYPENDHLPLGGSNMATSGSVSPVAAEEIPVFLDGFGCVNDFYLLGM